MPDTAGKIEFFVIFLVLILAGFTLLGWSQHREKATKDAASKERSRVFGQDPLLPGGHPHWAPGVDTDQLTIGIRDLIASAPTTLPHQSQEKAGLRLCNAERSELPLW